MGLFDFRYRVRKKGKGPKAGLLFAWLKARRIPILISATAAAVVLIVALAPPKKAPSNMPAPSETIGLTSGSPMAPPSAASPSTAPQAAAPTPEPELRMGIDSESVRDLQKRLMELGYIDIDETTAHFGPATNFALQLFQRQHSLQVDGIFGGETKRVLFSDEARPYTLFEGALGLDVKMLQERLKQLGYMKQVTGFFGMETTKAVKAFQKRNSLKEDGKAGQRTLDLVYSPSAKGPVTVTSSKGSSKDIGGVIALAKRQLGKRYSWGATGPNSFDCSGLVYYLLTHNGVKTGRFNAAGYSNESKWQKITKMSDLKAGDIVFFSTNGKRVGHTGLYIGNGEMIDASSSNGKVVRRSCTTPFWKRNFVCGRRPW